MNVLSLTTAIEPPDLTYVEIRIDGTLLEHLARAVEEPFAEREGHPNIAGDYVGPDYPEFLHVGRDMEATLLVCEGCREPGCWPLTALIEWGDAEVRWYGFRQPHRRSWDLGALGPFTFDREQYEKQLKKVRGSFSR